MADLSSQANNRQFDLDTTGSTDYVDAAVLAVASATGAQQVGGVVETGTSAVGALAVGGGTPHDSVDSGNPVKIGGYASNTAPTNVADGDRVNGWFDRQGALFTRVTGSVTQGIADVLQQNADTQSAAQRGLMTAALGYGYNGTSWDRVRTEAGTTGFLGIGGSVAHDSVDAGNPVKIGGYAHTDPQGVTQVASGDRVNAIYDRYGRLAVVVGKAAGSSDAQLDNGVGYLYGLNASGGSQLMLTGMVPFLSNGTTWDRQRDILGVAAGASSDVGIAAAGVGPGYSRIPAAVAASGATTATVSALGASQVVFNVAGTFTGFAATVQVSYDGTNYLTVGSGQAYIDGLGVSGVGTAITATATPGRVFVNTWGAQQVRLNVTAVASGTATITMTANATGSIPGSGGSVVDTELPTAAASADATSNPTIPGVGAYNMVFNGTTWDRARSEAGTTGFMGVGGSVAHNATDAGNPVKIGGKANGSMPTLVTAGNRVEAWYSRGGVARVGHGENVSSADALSGGNIYMAEDPQTNVSAPTGVMGQLYNGSTIDRWRSVDAYKTAAASPDVGLLAVVHPDRRFTSVSLGTVIGNTQAWDPIGAKIAIVFVGTTTTGTFTFEVSADGTNYIAATVWDTATETDVSGTNLTPTANKIYRVSVGGYRSVRARTIATLGATVSLIATLGFDDEMVVPQGSVAHDSPDVGNPLKIGGVASTSTPTTVAVGDRVNAWYGTSGAAVVTFGSASGNDTDASAMLSPAGINSFHGLPFGASAFSYNGTTWDRSRNVTPLQASGANVDTGILAVGIGPGYDRKRDPSNLGTAANSASTFQVAGADTVVIDVRTSTTGTYAIELTADDTNWVTAGSVLALNTELWVTPSGLTPTSGDRFKVAVTGYRQIRLRTVTTLGATLAHKITFSSGVHLVRAVDIGAAPHSIGFPIVNKVAQYTTTQTGAALWTPGSGKKIVVTSYQIQVGGTTAGTLQVWFGASGDTTYTRGTDYAIFDGEFAPSATLKPGVVQTGVWMADAADRVLRVTDSAAINPLTVTVWGYEV